VEVLSSATSLPQNIPSGCAFGTATFKLSNGSPAPLFFNQGPNLIVSPTINEDIGIYTVVAELTFLNELPYTTVPFQVQVIPKYIAP